MKEIKLTKVPAFTCPQLYDSMLILIHLCSNTMQTASTKHVLCVSHTTSHQIHCIFSGVTNLHVVYKCWKKGFRSETMKLLDNSDHKYNTTAENILPLTWVWNISLVIIGHTGK